ncbi:MAG: hypothetical protein Q4A83_04875 [Bacillota bacterium]|nr:hypothetical protein [Bacillota bacterium]
MKRTLLTVISVILALVSMFGIYASFVGIDDTGSILLEKNKQKAAIIQNIDLIEDSVEELDKLAEDRAQDEMDFAEGTAAQAEGGKQLDAGQAKYDAGKAQYDAGKAQYDAGEREYNSAKALYDQKKQEYDHAVDNLEEAKNQLESAKAQRDAGQAKLDAATAAYNALKGLQSTGQDWVGYIADGVARQYGYSSAAAAISEYESGQAQLASANAQIADAEQQIANGEAQLADAKQQLDAGKDSLTAPRASLTAAQASSQTAKRLFRTRTTPWKRLSKTSRNLTTPSPLSMWASKLFWQMTPLRKWLRTAATITASSALPVTSSQRIPIMYPQSLRYASSSIPSSALPQ